MGHSVFAGVAQHLLLGHHYRRAVPYPRPTISSLRARTKRAFLAHGERPWRKHLIEAVARNLSLFETREGQKRCDFTLSLQKTMNLSQRPPRRFFFEGNMYRAHCRTFFGGVAWSRMRVRISKDPSKMVRPRNVLELRDPPVNRM